MGIASSVASGVEHDVERSSNSPLQAQHHRWGALHYPNRRCVEDDAQRSSSVEDLLPLLSSLGEAGRLETDSQCIEGLGPREARKKKAPTAAILDSQSVRTASQPGLRGFDAGKKITGRKRHVLVDTLGFILALKVTSADVQDRDGARLLLPTSPQTNSPAFYVVKRRLCECLLPADSSRSQVAAE